MSKRKPTTSRAGATLLLSVLSSPAAAQQQSAASVADDLSLVDLLEMRVVSPALREQSLREAAAVIEVISSVQIEERGYRSVGEALESVAGVDLLHDHYQYNLGVRGVSSGHLGWSRIVKVMIDGQPVAFRPSGENLLGPELIPIGAVERIEVIRGPASVLYGANAFLGVVNIVTKDGGSLDWGAGRLGFEVGPRVRSSTGEAVLGNQFGDLTFVAAAGVEATERDEYRLTELPGRTHRLRNELSDTEPHPSGSAFFRVGYDHGTFGHLALDGTFQRLDRDAEFMDWGVMAHDNRLQLYNSHLRLSYRKSWGDRVDVSISAAIASGHTGPDDRLNTAPDLDTHIERELGYVGQDLQSTLSYSLDDRSDLLLGVDYSADHQETQAFYTVTAVGERYLNPPAGTRTGMRWFSDLGVFTQLILYPFPLLGSSWLPGLGLTAGARFDTQNIYGDDYNARAGIVYAHPSWFTKLLAGTSYRAPSASQLFSNYIHPGGSIGNPDLKPERARTVELAVGGTPVPELTATASAYVTRIEDRVELREPAATSSISNDYPHNATPIDCRGVESKIDVQVGSFRGYVSYSYAKSTYRKRNLLSLAGEEVTLDTDLYPSHLLKAGLTQHLPRWHLVGNLEGRYVGRRLGFLANNALVNGPRYLTERYALHPYVVIDATLTTSGIELWPRRETRFSTRVSNLLGVSYAFPGYDGFDIPGFERSVSLLVRQEL